MALLILEESISSLSPWGDETTDLALTAKVVYIDTSQPDPTNVVVEEYTPVRIPVAATDVPAMAEARSAAYRARCQQLFGAAVPKIILLDLAPA